MLPSPLNLSRLSRQWNAPLTKQIGVVAQAAGDWSMGDALSVFSLTAVSLGVTTFVLGPWQERSGPRMVAFAVAQTYAAAFALTGLGAQCHSIGLMYAGYGVLGGIGWGLGCACGSDSIPSPRGWLRPTPLVLPPLP